MDTLRFLLAIVLTIAVIALTNLLFPPQPAPEAEERPAVEERVDERAAERTPEEPAAEPERDRRETEEELAEFARRRDAADEPEPEADTIVVESALYRYAFTTRGAGVVSAELREFESATSNGPVQLVPEDAGPLVGYRLEIGDRLIDLGELPFELVDGPEPGAAAVPDSLRFVYAAENGRFGIEIRYRFDPERYVVDAAVRVAGVSEAAHVWIDLGPTLAINEADPEEDRRALAYVVNAVDDGIRSVPLEEMDEEPGERIEEGPLLWAALKNKYFLAAALRDPEAGGGEYFGGVIAEDVPGDHTARVSATLPFAGSATTGYRLYLGSQDYGRLAELGEGIEDVNPYGWRLLQPIIRPLGHFITWALIGLQGLLGLGYGWVLILFGFLVQLALWPLNTKAMRSQIKNMELQPVIKEIQQKYKDDPERLQKEMVRLYKEEGFNPLGGCLPMLIPFPILITLFFVFQNTIEFRGVEFLWLPDLSRPDPVYLLPILLGLSMFVTQWISMRSTAQQNPQMKIMMWGMPIFMVVIFFNLASGLNLYYAASNVAAIPRQMVIMRERKQAQARVKPRS